MGLFNPISWDIFRQAAIIRREDARREERELHEREVVALEQIAKQKGSAS